MKSKHVLVELERKLMDDLKCKKDIDKLSNAEEKIIKTAKSDYAKEILLLIQELRRK